MPLAVQCPHCSARFSAQERHAGRVAKCPKCAEPFQVAAASIGGSSTDKTAAAPAPAVAPKPVASKPAAAPAARAVAQQQAPKAQPRAPQKAAGKSASAGRDDAARQILNGFAGKVARARTPLSYLLAAVVVAVLMVLLPVIYVGLIALVGYGTYYHAVYDTGMLAVEGVRNGRAQAFLLMAYVAPIVGGAIAVIFMVKPLFARAQGIYRQRSLRRESEPLLFAFVDRVCETVGAPKPRRIDVDCQVNASASFRRGLWSLFGSDLVLTIGMPLVAGLNTRQFAGVLAHEFGHFSQGFGMRLTYLIRSLNSWFMRVVYQRDRWDAWLEHGAESLDVRIGWVLYVAMACVWLSRRVLWALMYVGHFFGSHLLRQMEFDADRYETRLAGSESFAQTVRQLHVLNYASEGAFADLRELYRDGRLVDDLPRLVMARAAAAPADLAKRIDETIDRSETHWFDTHPCDADRVAAAQREGGAGVFAIELPASTLFADYEAQSKAATWDFYRGIFGNEVKQSQLQPVAAVESRHEQVRQGGSALEEFFQGEWHTAAPLPLSSVHLAAPANPSEALAQLKLARVEMEQALPGVRGAAEGIRNALDQASESQQLQYWLRAKAKVKKEALEKWGGQAGVDRAARRAPDDVERAVARLQPYNAAAARRIALALQLAHVRKVAQRVKSPLALDELHKQFDALRALGEQMPTLAGLYPRHLALGGMLESLQQGGDQENLVPIIRDLMSKLHPPTALIRKALARCDYPFDHAKGKITLAHYLMADVPIADDLGSIFNSLGQAIEQAPSLYIRSLGQVVAAVVAVEQACGLPPAPASPQPVSAA